MTLGLGRKPGAPGLGGRLEVPTPAAAPRTPRKKRASYAKPHPAPAADAKASAPARKGAGGAGTATAKRKSVKASAQGQRTRAKKKQAAGSTAGGGQLLQRDGGAKRGTAAGAQAARRSARSSHDALAAANAVERTDYRPTDEQLRRAGARRVSDKRTRERAERAARNRKRYRAYILRILLAVVVVLGMVFGSIFLYRSDVFAVDNVVVTGVEHLTDQEITQLAAIPDDSTLLRLESTAIAERLESHPWIQEAVVKRQFPDTVVLEITERAAAAAVKLSDTSIWVISTDGVWLSAATKSDWKSNHKIVDTSATLASPVAGSDCNDEGIKNALAVYSGISDTLAKQVKSISAESTVKTTLTLKSGVTVAFGEAVDIELKEADIWALLDEYDGTVSYINVRVPSRPTFRTL